MEYIVTNTHKPRKLCATWKGVIKIIFGSPKCVSRTASLRFSGIEQLERFQMCRPITAVHTEPHPPFPLDIIHVHINIKLRNRPTTNQQNDICFMRKMKTNETKEMLTTIWTKYIKKIEREMERNGENPTIQ